MRLFTFILFVIIPFASFAQGESYLSRTYNLHDKDAATIRGYAEEFVSSNKELFSNRGKDSVFAEAGLIKTDGNEVIVRGFSLMKNTNKFCFGNLVLDYEVVFMANVGTSTIALKDIKYFIIPPGGTSKCSGGGTLTALKQSDCCKTYTNIDKYLGNVFMEIGKKYKRFLASKK